MSLEEAGKIKILHHVHFEGLLIVQEGQVHDLSKIVVPLELISDLENFFVNQFRPFDCYVTNVNVNFVEPF